MASVATNTDTMDLMRPPAAKSKKRPGTVGAIAVLARIVPTVILRARIVASLVLVARIVARLAPLSHLDRVLRIAVVKEDVHVPVRLRHVQGDGDRVLVADVVVREHPWHGIRTVRVQDCDRLAPRPAADVRE